jgi:hypothetical protein
MITPFHSQCDTPTCFSPQETIIIIIIIFFFFSFFFFQPLNFLLESFGLPNDLFPFPSILDAGYPVFDPHLANVLFNVILPSVLGYSL